MSTPDRAEISRRNSRKSTGPRTVEGKNRSRLNALKHGMTASIPVLPGEDGEVLRGRIDAWTDDLQPRSLLESHFIEQAAQLSWQLERIERAHVARLTTNIENAEAGAAASVAEEREVAALGARLFEDRRGPLQFYPNLDARNGHSPRTSCSGVADDPGSPAQLVIQLESTLVGCGWMLDRWAELKARLASGKSWQSPDKLKAIRLLGKQPLDAADDADVASIFIACHAIDPQYPSAFAELRSDADDWEWKKYEKRLDKRTLELDFPGNAVEGREALSRIVENAMDRLESRAETFRQLARRDARLAADRLSFDDSSEGERLRRYATTCGRGLQRAVDSIIKMRLIAKDRDSSVDEECDPVAAIEFDSPFRSGDDTAAESIDHPVVSAPPIVTPRTELTRPTAPAESDTQVPAEPKPIVEYSILRNEASPIAPHPTEPIEPMTARSVRRAERRMRRKAGRDRSRRNKELGREASTANRTKVPNTDWSGSGHPGADLFPTLQTVNVHSLRSETQIQAEFAADESLSPFL